MKVLVLHHPYERPRFEQDFVDRLGQRAAFDIAPADLEALAEGQLGSAGRNLNLGDYVAIIVFVAFGRLRQAEPLDWRGFSGMRVLFDHDVIQNYSDIFDPTLRGTWPPEFRRHRFDLLLTSGGGVRQRLEDDGIAAAWLPKGFEPARFVDQPGPREDIATYGSAYRCRVIAERAIVRSGVTLNRIPFTAYAELGPILARHLAALAISADLRVPLWLRDKIDGIPPTLVPMRPGLEPMAKLFEAAGAGCCPVADDMEDLKPLGFVDGETAITFRSFRELADKLRHWASRPDDLRKLGSAAARLAHERHSWEQRAGELEALLAARLSA